MAHHGLADLDELILLCRDDKARSYISEAVACYKTGAFRQCIVATWIAVVFDIIEKLQELARTGDAQAQQKIAEYEKIWQAGDIRAALDFERQIVDMARDDFELLSLLEHIDMTRLRDDRNRCAHPSLNTIEEIYQPSAELARTHLRNAVTSLLQHPPVQGKAALERVVNDVASEYFPINVDKAVTYFSTGPLARPRESLVRNFSQLLVKAILFDELDDKATRRYYTALAAIRKMHRNTVEEAFVARLNDLMLKVGDTALWKCINFLHEIVDTWQYLKEDMHTRLENYVRNLPRNDISPAILYALEIADLKESAAAGLSNIDLNQFLLLTRLDQFEFTPDFVEIAVSLYEQVGSFVQANSAARSLIIPVVRTLNREQIERIFRAARENDQILHSFERSEVFTAIRNSGVLPDGEIEGLYIEYGFEGELEEIESDIEDEDIPF